MPVAHSYDQAMTQIEALVDRFDRTLDTYKRTNYKETQVRVEFIRQ